VPQSGGVLAEERVDGHAFPRRPGRDRFREDGFGGGAECGVRAGIAYEAALSMLDSIEATESDAAVIWLVKSRVLLAAQHFDRVDLLLQLAPTTLKGTYHTLLIAGDAKLGQRQWAEAQHFYLGAAQAAPTLAAARVRLALLTMAEGQVDEALAQFDDAQALPPTDVDIFKYRALILTEHGDLAGAAAQLEVESFFVAGRPT
jgi:tetratricopeptide (TPR) repeat protein